MTTHALSSFVTAATAPAVLTVAVDGVLDYDTSDALVDAVTDRLACPGEGPGPWQDLRLDCAGLTWIDSSGLAALLMIRRRAGTASVTVHLDNRPAFLDRLLHLTDTFAHLTQASDAACANVSQVSDLGAT
jgi:anti-anti-sigma factor